MSTVPFVSSTDTLDGNFRATAQSPTPGETIQTRLIEAPRPWYIACWTKRIRLFIGGSSVLLMRYMVCTFLAGFFPVYAENKLGLTALGTAFVIAAYPIGMSITSFIAPSLIRKMGTRNATLIGLCATIFFTMLLGLVPSMTSSKGGQIALFVITYSLNGLCGAFAETASIIMIGARFKDRSASAMVGVNIASTIGCSLGPLVGGVFHDLPSHEDWKFRLPCFVLAALPITVLVALPWFMPNEHISGEESSEASPPAEVTSVSPLDIAVAPLPTTPNADGSTTTAAMAYTPGQQGPAAADPNINSPGSNSESFLKRRAAAAAASNRGGLCPSWLSLSVTLGLISYGLASLLVGTLDYSADIKLAAPPLRLCAATVGSLFTVSSLLGACVSIPSGPLADKFQHNSRVCKLVTAGGFAGIGLGFALLGPFSWESIGVGSATSRGCKGSAPPPPGLLSLAESMAAAYAGMIIKSVGNVYAQVSGCNSSTISTHTALLLLLTPLFLAPPPHLSPSCSSLLCAHS